MKRIVAWILICVLAAGLCGCNIAGGGSKRNNDTGNISVTQEPQKKSVLAPGNPTEPVEGYWPNMIYDTYSIPMPLSSSGEVVYTDFDNPELPYSVYWRNFLWHELKDWVILLQSYGFRVNDYTMERLEDGGRDEAMEVFFPSPKSEYKLLIAYSFISDMNMEYTDYANPDNKNFIFSEEMTENGHLNIAYNLRISLCPLNTEQELIGSCFGVTPQEICFSEHIRKVELVEDEKIAYIAIEFYSDYMPTQDDVLLSKKTIYTALAKHGAVFQDERAFDVSLEDAVSSGYSWLFVNGNHYSADRLELTERYNDIFYYHWKIAVHEDE